MKFWTMRMKIERKTRSKVDKKMAKKIGMETETGTRTMGMGTTAIALEYIPSDDKEGMIFRGIEASYKDDVGVVDVGLVGVGVGRERAAGGGVGRRRRGSAYVLQPNLYLGTGIGVAVAGAWNRMAFLCAIDFNFGMH